MSYVFDIGISLEDNLRRVAGQEVQKARDSLARIESAPEESVHDLRKRMKKLRGLLRLLRPGLGKTYKAENAAAREIARGFSDIRDAQVMVNSVDLICNEAGADTALLAPLRDWAEQRRQRVLKVKGIKTRARAARAALKTLRARSRGWRLSGDPAEVLEAGLNLTLGRAAEGFVIARQGGAGEQLHEWRKRVKYHRYHCRLLAPAWPDAVLARAALADQVAEAVGTDRDLLVLRQAMASAPPGNLPRDTVHLAGLLSLQLGDRLRLQALAEAPKLFVDDAGTVAHGLAAWWAVAAANKRRG